MKSKGRPATQIEIEAFTAIANLQDENRELRVKIKQLEAENKRLSEEVNNLKMDIGYLRREDK